MSTTSKTYTPKEDDYTVCFYCACICRFNADLTLRVAQEHELTNEVLRVSRFIRKFNDERNS